MLKKFTKEKNHFKLEMSVRSFLYVYYYNKKTWATDIKSLG